MKQVQILMLEEEKNRQERIKYWTKVLKGLRTWEEFKEFYAQLEEEDFCLTGKRRGIQVFGFRHKYDKDYPFEPHMTRVTYCYDDGSSSGDSEISNLYKVIRVTE